MKTNLLSEMYTYPEFGEEDLQALEVALALCKIHANRPDVNLAKDENGNTVITFQGKEGLDTWDMFKDGWEEYATSGWKNPTFGIAKVSNKRFYVMTKG